MRIEAKWPGKCFECGGPIKKGSEIEYREKRAFHPACWVEEETVALGREAFELAARLGYVEPTDGEITRMAKDWILWRVPQSSEGTATRRVEPATPGRHASLFDEEADIA